LCITEYDAERYWKAPELYRGQSRKYLGEHKEENRVNCKAWYTNNKDRVKSYAEANKERLVAYRRGRAEQALATNREWRENNRERVNANACKRRRDNPKLRIAARMSGRISEALHGKASKNGRHWEDLVGYKMDDLIAHLQSKFLSGMSLANYGKGGWHVDHIIPVAAFTFSSTDDPEFRKCFALSNLQPLWEKDNLSKNDKVEVNGEYVHVHLLRKRENQAKGSEAREGEPAYQSFLHRSGRG
jgi:hypothetical protein